MASSSRMHGLHEVDQNDTIIGFPVSTRVFVSNDSPFAFSTFTDGTCANASVEMSNDIDSKNVLIAINNIGQS